MRQITFINKAFAASLLILFCVSSGIAQFKTVGYMPSWAGSPADIQYSKLTHINYAFIRPTTTGGLTAVDQPSKLQDIVSRAHAANVKVGIAVGGWSDLNNQDFESMAGNSTYRNNFVNNIVNLIGQYGLDGVDIDWEYPTGGNNPANFNTLMGQLSTAMHSRSKFLSAAVAANGSNADGVQSGVFSSVDFLNLMAYDGGGSNHSTYDYALQTINYWKGRGLQASKAILGVPFYGRSPSEYVAYNTLLLRGASPNSDFFGNIGYNGIPTIKSKTNLAFDQGGGIMIWEISQDVNNSNSLLTAINQVVIERSGGGGCSGSYTSLPATIQAESYCMVSGVQTETTTDTGGGQNVGYIDAGDWMVYRINVPAAGNYKIQYRVASLNGGGSIRFERAGGSPVFGTITVSSTGGWQNWQTISHNVDLPAGQQEVGIAAAAGGFNINWFSISANNNSSAPIGQTIWLKGSNSLYASSENGTQAMRCNRATVQGWEQFTVVDAGGGKIALTSQSKYVSSENGTQAITCSRASIGDWEKFDWVINGNGTISLRGNNARYVSSENGTQAMTCNRVTAGGWEQFTWGTGTGGAGGRLATRQQEQVMSLNALEENDVLAVYPNPSIGRVTIKVSKPSHVKILDASGRTFHSSYVEESLTIDRMNAGIYIVRMHNSLQTRTQKLVIK